MNVRTAEAKTRPTEAPVAEHLAAIEPAERRADCDRLVELMRRTTGEPPSMWGPSIVGFGRYAYRYDSGRGGEAPLVGFAARKDGLAVYLLAEGEAQAERLAQLGRHKMGKACLTLRRLADVDLGVLEQMLAASVAELRRRHPGP